MRGGRPRALAASAVAAALALGFVFAPAPALARSDDLAAPYDPAGRAPRIVSVEPARDGVFLVCRVLTSGLPGEDAARSIESGLPASIEMALDLVDENERVVAGNRISFAVAFDLWEEIFRVECESPGGPDGDARRAGDPRDPGVPAPQRLDDLESVARILSDLPRLRVAPLTALAPSRRFRVRVGMRVHPVAPSSRSRVGEWVAGDAAAGVPGDPDAHEISIGLGDLIRFIYGRSEQTRGDRDAQNDSPWFLPEDLVDAAD